MAQAAEVGSTANSYAILAKLATGGMAEIFLARNASGAGIERYVVLKRVLRHKANDETFVHMFLDEARLAAQLQHPNIAQVYDTGVLGDSYFFTMEYVHGETVREVLHRCFAAKVQIPISVVLTVASAAASGLHHAHERIGIDGKPLGIVHRDVSPSNLMVSFEGNVKIVDFGVAKATQRRTETQAGTVKGKIAYLSPEQCRGRAMDRRSDLFSLGIVMWEMLVGDRLYKQATDYEIMEAIVQSTPPPPSARRGDVPPQVDAIVSKLLARDPDKRFQTADELQDAIEHAAVAVGVPLSSKALGKFVRELFGPRPEPWVEMQAQRTTPEVVTVTAAPIVGDPVGTAAAGPDLDSKLANVPQFESRMLRTPTPLPFLDGLTPTPQPVPALPEGVPSSSYNQFPSTGSYSSVRQLPRAPGQRRSFGVIVGVASVAIAIGVIVIFATRSGASSDDHVTAPAADVDHATPAAPPPPVEAAKPAPPPPAPAPAPVEVAKPAPHPVQAAKPAVKPELAKPEPAKPEPVAEPAKPAPPPVDEVKPDPMNTVAAKPDPTKPDPNKPATPKTEPVKPRAEPVKPKTDATKPKTDKPKPSDCDVDPMSCRR